jgi:hypothetical protein
MWTAWHILPAALWESSMLPSLQRVSHCFILCYSISGYCTSAQTYRNGVMTINTEIRIALTLYPEISTERHGKSTANSR